MAAGKARPDNAHPVLQSRSVSQDRDLPRGPIANMRGEMSSFPTGSASDSQIAADRSRRGKAQSDDLRVIALFRHPATVGPGSEAEIADRIAPPAPSRTDEHAPRAIAKGVVVGLLISIALWAAIGFAAWYVL
jgi:hypothetical protein